MTEFRRDPLLQRWVIISNKRSKRPSDFKTVDGDSHKPGPCAFCPGFERETGREVYAVRDGREGGAGDWRLRVVVNMFPAVSAEAHCGPPSEEEDPVFGECRLPGFGSHEVVIETPNHDLGLADLAVPHIAEVILSQSMRDGFNLKNWGTGRGEKNNLLLVVGSFNYVNHG